MKKIKVLAAMCVAFTTASVFADVTINITGATAFRAASNNAILNMLQDVEYAYTGDQGLRGSNRAIFKGTLPGIPGTTIIRTSWSGSAGGVRDILQANPVPVLLESTPMSAAGTNVADPQFESAVAKFAFSDVAQVATPTPTPALEGTPVGVVPFMFVANKSTPETVTNMTDQLFFTAYQTGQLPLSMLTGDPADADVVVLPTGRAASSGTRITMLAETGYGIARPVQQWQATRNAETNQIGEPTLFGDDGNLGYSSNSFIRDLMIGESTGFLFMGYLTISDALAAIEAGARELKYNGVAYSEENVKSGAYSLWGYQQFYNAPGLSEAEQTFRAALINTIPTTMGNAGIPIPDMQVTRSGGDGGPIFPND